METVTVSRKFQIVIPESIRKILNIKPGEKMVVIEKDGIIRMIRVAEIKKAKGIAKGVSVRDLRDEYERVD